MKFSLFHRRVLATFSRRVTRRLKVATTLILLFTVSVSANPGIEFFESKIRPVLAQECYECHSSAGKQKGGLILDYRDGLLTGGDSGPAIQPGDANASLLMEALRHENDLEMPKAGVKLDAPIIADFEKWINMGAPDPRDNPPTKEQLEADTNWSAIFKTRQNWWSFQPVKDPPVPTGDGTPIDRFIHAELQKSNLQPSAPAEPRTLARRIHYAITGLPATTEALDEFEKNPDTEKLIDQLLTSPHFGERWARHWMDWVRYAESHGSEGDPKIDNAYLYRDYLIRALNRDVPYNQLLREHIAGDLLENPRIHQEEKFNESTIGTTHWRMCFHGFAPTDALDEKVRFTDDQINTFTKAFQGLTVSCARCHDHKFDAISQADYYALFGILGSTRPGRKLIDLPDTLDHNKAKLSSLKPKIRTAVADHWLASLDKVKLPKETLPADKPATPKLSINLAAGEDYKDWFKYGNGVTEKPAASGEFMITTTGPNAIERILPTGMYSGLLSTKHAGRLTSPDIGLTGKNTLLLLVNGGGKAINRYVVQNYPRSGTVFKIDRFGDTKKKKKKEPTRPNWYWKSYNLDYWDGDQIHIELATAKDTALLVDNTERSWFGIREARIIETGQPVPKNVGKEYLEALTSDNPVDDIRTSIENWKNNRATDAQALLLDHLIAEEILPNRISNLPNAKALIKEYRKLEAEIKSPTRVPGIDEWTAADQPLYDRGDHKKPLEPVSRRFIEAVDATPYSSKQSGRLEMAEDMLRDDNPFTRRVIVNRIWTHLFGNGLVGSVDNFGRLGEKPSHPELLDYLATRFDRDLNWSIKSLIKEIVSSKTWQQNSTASTEAKAIDPENRLLSYYPVRRLEAESIRDKLLAVSGSLDPRMYGPAASGASTRRSVYVNVIRNRLDEFLSVFDAPVPFSTTGKRPVTNVPAQSLTMLNDPSIKRFAASFSTKFRGTDEDKVQQMWNQALGRNPDNKEVAASLRFLENLRARSKEIETEVTNLSSKIAELHSTNNAILAPARKKLESDTDTGKPVDIEALGAIANWDFRKPPANLGGKLTGNARIESDGLVLDGMSSFFSDPLKLDLREKTLEVQVTLSTLNQRAGGAVTVQDLRGGLFDSIVFAERRTAEWMSGSNSFSRTTDFNGPADTTAAETPAHITIAYDSDGTIHGYRNGEPYGAPYKSNGPAHFKKGDSQIVLGLRHGTKNGGRNLKGTIHLARVYNRALSEDEIASLAQGKNVISRKAILNTLSDEEKDTYHENASKLESLNQQLSQLHKENSETGEKAVWQSYAHSLFNLKEFIYVH